MKEQGKNKSIAIVVVTYNRKVLLKEALDAIANQNVKDVKVIVVDNASTDGTQEYIADVLKDSRFSFLNTGVNLGGAGGFNFGIKEAVKLGCDYIWIMDDDCIVHKDSLEKLLQFAKEKNDDFGFLSSVVKWTDDSICRMNIQKYSLKNQVTDFETNGQRIKMATFVSLFFKRSVVEDVGLPIKEFFIWGDDIEYTNRISKKYNCYLVTDSVVTHKCNSNVGSNIAQDEESRLDRYFYAYRNEGYMYRREGLKGKIYYFLKKWLHRLRILKSKAPSKKKRFAVMKKGLKAVKKFNPPIEYVYGPDTQVKVLEFFGEPLLYGGQEAFMINMYKNFDNKNIHYTFCTPFESGNKTMIQMAKDRGDEIVAYNYKFESKTRKLSVKKAAKDVLSKNKFDVIHIHTGSVFTIIEVAKLAKKYGVKSIIAHSHATGYNTFKYRLIKKHSDKKIGGVVTHYYACSDSAAAWKFPKDIISAKNYSVIKNGIETEDYKFNNKTREEYRKKLGLGNDFTVCMVGRFAEPKNHIFIVDLMDELLKRDKKIRCVFVGSGDTKPFIIDTIKEKKIDDRFLFLENRSDVNNILMACDVFVFPSKFEGLGIVAIESQASGLPTVCSEFIPQETNLTDVISYHSLDKQQEWIDKISEIKNMKVDRSRYAKVVADAGYDAKESAKFLEDKYLGLK